MDLDLQGTSEHARAIWIWSRVSMQASGTHVTASIRSAKSYKPSSDADESDSETLQKC